MIARPTKSSRASVVGAITRAARVMAPTTDHLHDFVGRALLGLPLLGEV